MEGEGVKRGESEKVHVKRREKESNHQKSKGDEAETTRKARLQPPEKQGYNSSSKRSHLSSQDELS